MFQSHAGEFAALAVAVFWTITALAFESASKKVGSLPVNWIRLLVGFVFLSVFTFFYRGLLLPVDASAKSWFWLTLSGIVGFAYRHAYHGAGASNDRFDGPDLSA
jgi:uncharacterized membrane protein